jgi:MFS family permease
MDRRVELLLFTAGWGANHFSTLLVVYRRDLGLSPSVLGILFAAYALGLVPGLVLAGRASDGLGRRALVLPAGLLAIAASAVLAWGGHGFGVLLAGRLLYGLAMGSIMSPGSVWVQELSSPATGARRATLALSAGFGLGPLVSGVIAELAPAPMVLPYIAHVAVMAASLFYARPVPETATRAARARAPVAGAPPPVVVASPPVVVAPVVAPAFGRAELRVLAELLPIAPWAFGLPAVTLAILPGLLRAHVARPVIYSALVILTTLLSGMLVQPLTKRVGPRADLLGLGVGALGIALGARAVAVVSPALVFAVALLVGAGYGLVMTTGLIEISERVARPSRGTAVGIYYVVTYLGFSLPFIHAHATAAMAWGDAVTLQITAAVAAACVLIRLAVVRASARPAASG